MMVYAYLKLAALFSVVVFNWEKIVTIAVVIMAFVFFLGCMGKAVGMDVTFNVAIIFTTLVAGIGIFCKIILVAAKTFGKIIKGIFKGTEDTALKFGATPKKARASALILTGLMLAILI